MSVASPSEVGGDGMELLSEAVDRLTRLGFTEHFRAEGASLVVANGDGRRFAPERLIARETLRFEGTSDPADEVILVALETPSGDVRGTFCAAFGPCADPDEAAVLQRIHVHESEP